MSTESPSWLNDALDRLAKVPCGYHPGEPNAAEPVALSALALLGANRHDETKNHLCWLAGTQHAADGSVSPYADLTWPSWPTPMAIIVGALIASSAESTTENLTNGHAPASNINLETAKQWLVAAEGTQVPKSSEFGHDGMLVGWPWVLGTHSWQEPTAWSVLALKSLGLSDHPRTREAVRMLIDRLLPEGGCNYGNTYVLGQKLRAQIEPTGIAMLALAGEQSDDLRIAYSLQYLTASLSAETTSISLSYGLLGLTAHHRAPVDSAAWLEAAYRRTIDREASPLKIALLTLAAQGEECPLIQLAQSKIKSHNVNESNMKAVQIGNISFQNAG